jgi:hypothetical protein
MPSEEINKELTLIVAVQEVENLANFVASKGAPRFGELDGHAMMLVSASELVTYTAAVIDRAIESTIHAGEMLLGEREGNAFDDGTGE